MAITRQGEGEDDGLANDLADAVGLTGRHDNLIEQCKASLGRRVKQQTATALVWRRHGWLLARGRGSADPVHPTGQSPFRVLRLNWTGSLRASGRWPGPVAASVARGCCHPPQDPAGQTQYFAVSTCPAPTLLRDRSHLLSCRGLGLELICCRAIRIFRDFRYSSFHPTLPISSPKLLIACGSSWVSARRILHRKPLPSLCLNCSSSLHTCLWIASPQRCGSVL